MDLHHLRVFHATVKSGGFSRNGEQLHLSQSTVSQHIKLLGREVGCPLFLRVGKRVQVTEAGKVLLPYAERIFCDLKNAEMALREMNELRRGTARVGVGPTTLIYRLPPVVSEYRRRFIEPFELTTLCSARLRVSPSTAFVSLHPGDVCGK
jgi:DNA-binding transcriptional LysR family regulator